MTCSIIHHIPLDAIDEDVAIAQGPGGRHVSHDMNSPFAVPERVAGQERGDSGTHQANASALAEASHVAFLDTAGGAATIN